MGRLRDVKASGLTMDVDHMSSIRVDKDNNRERWVAFNRATGARMSAMEHLVPEEMYSTEDNPAHGISAVKALQLAAAEGQKIWTITQSNLSQAMAGLNLSSSVEADIRNAVRAGKEVTAHEDTINFRGRPSAGYMVIDPETGAGGYLIAGGENGGFLSVIVAAMLGFLGGITTSGQSGQPMFSERLKALARQARYVSILGVISLLIDVLSTLGDDTLSVSSKIGRFSTAIFAYASTSLVTLAAFSVLGGPVAAAIVGLLFASMITALLISFNSRYFSVVTYRSIRVYA